MRKRKDNNTRWRRNNSEEKGKEEKVTIREGKEEEQEGKEKGGRRKVNVRIGEKEAAKKKGECNQRETIGQKHSGGKEQRTGEETNKNKILTVGTQCFNSWETMQRPFQHRRLYGHRDGNHFT